MRPRLHAAALAAVLAAVAVLSLRQVGSLDVGFHLRAGEQILSGRGWPRHDTFTATVAGQPYVDTSWGYQLLAAAAHRIGDAPGLVLLHAAAVLGVFAILALTCRIGPAGPTTLAALLLVGALASEMRFEVRPEVFSYLFLSVVLHLLHRRAEGKPAPLWPLPLIHLVWANTHSLFILGWAAIGCFAAGMWLRDRRIDAQLLRSGALAVAAAFVNPYGWRGVAFPFTLATRLEEENLFARSIGEFVSPFALRISEQFPFYPRAPIFAFRAFVFLSAAALPLLLRRRRFACALLWLAFLPLAARMVRNMPLLVIAALPGTAWGLAAADPTARRSGRTRGALRAAAAAGVLAASAVVGLRAWNDAHYVASRRPERTGLGWNRLALPLDAADHVVRAGIRGPVLNHLDFGGWLMWAQPEPVFIDGRLEVMGEAFYAEYRRVLASGEALEARAARDGIRWIVFPYAGNPDLLRRLGSNTRWRLAYVDHLAAIFVREGPGAGALVDPELPRRLAPAGVAGGVRSLPGLGGPPRAGRAVRWIRGLARREIFPTEEMNLGLFSLYRGDLGAAEARFSAAVSESGGAYYEAYHNLGAVLFRLRRLPEARDCYAVVLEDDPDNGVALRRLAEIHRASALSAPP
jgi:tetratricopeptide (TPR) repeat protein